MTILTVKHTASSRTKNRTWKINGTCITKCKSHWIKKQIANWQGKGSVSRKARKLFRSEGKFCDQNLLNSSTVPGSLTGTFCFVNWYFHCIVFKIYWNFDHEWKQGKHKRAFRSRKVIGTLEKREACEQALRGALTTGREKEGELATTSLEFEFHLQFPCGSPSIELSVSCQSVRSGNERECKQALKNT